MTSSIVPSVDAALGLVCTIPVGERDARRTSVQAVVRAAVSICEIHDGVSLLFDDSADAARMITDLARAEHECCRQFTYTIVFAPRAGLELRVEAIGDAVGPLKGLYLGLATELVD